MDLDAALLWADRNAMGEAVERLRSRAAARALADEVRRLQNATAAYEAALKAAYPQGASGPAFDHWNEARRLLGPATKNT